MTTVENRSQELERLEGDVRLGKQLRTYLDGYYSSLQTVHPDRQFIPLKESVFPQSFEIIRRNNQIAQIVTSPRYEGIVSQERELKGECVLMLSICIDGRIPKIHILGRNGTIWESKAGIITLQTNINGNGQPFAGIIKENIKEKAQNGTPILNILLAHTPHCGAMAERKERGLVGDDIDDLVMENLRLHEQSAEAITRLYNTAAQKANQSLLSRAAITAVYDTNSMGFIFGYGTDHALSTTDATNILTHPLQKHLTDVLGYSYGIPGAFHTTFQDAHSIAKLEETICNISRFMLQDNRYDSFRTLVFPAIRELYPDISAVQFQALAFFIARNNAFQYLTGTHEDSDHPFSQHGEDYMAISRGDNKIVGQLDTEKQVFGASVSTVEEAVDHILTESKLMDHSGRVQPPYTLFVSAALAQGASEETVRVVRGRTRDFFDAIIYHEKILTKIVKGSLMVIPVIINEDTREVMEIPDFSI